MKYGWQIAAALLGLVAVWEVLKSRKIASSAVGGTSQSYVGIITPSNPATGSPGNPTGAFAVGLSQNPFDPNAVE